MSNFTQIPHIPLAALGFMWRTWILPAGDTWSRDCGSTIRGRSVEQGDQKCGSAGMDENFWNALSHCGSSDKTWLSKHQRSYTVVRNIHAACFSNIDPIGYLAIDISFCTCCATIQIRRRYCALSGDTFTELRSWESVSFRRTLNEIWLWNYRARASKTEKRKASTRQIHPRGWSLKRRSIFKVTLESTSLPTMIHLSIISSNPLQFNFGMAG